MIYDREIKRQVVGWEVEVGGAATARTTARLTLDTLTKLSTTVWIVNLNYGTVIYISRMIMYAIQCAV